MLERLCDILEDFGCKVSSSVVRDKVCTEVSFYSDAGEDFFFTIYSDGTERNFKKKITDEAYHFDPEEHALSLYAAARERIDGVPQSLRVLLDDADAIKEKLRILVVAVNTPPNCKMQKTPPIKEGMVLELRNGEKYQLICDYLVCENDYMFFDDFDEELKNEIKYQYDIMKVFQAKEPYQLSRCFWSDMECIWERECLEQ